jgi:transcriptional antiterminator
MLLINESEQKITIAKLANSLGVTPRTIHRHMCDELKQVKEELNEETNI